MQKAVLCLLPNLAPAGAPALWPDYLSALLDLLRPEQLAVGSPDAAPGRACDEAAGGDRCVRTWDVPPDEPAGSSVVCSLVTSLWLILPSDVDRPCTSQPELHKERRSPEAGSPLHRATLGQC